MDEHKRIYLKNMDVRKALFPMETAKQTDSIPVLTMKKCQAMTTLERLDRGKIQKEQADNDEKQFNQNAQQKKAKDEREKKEKEQQNEIQKRKRDMQQSIQRKKRAFGWFRFGLYIAFFYIIQKAHNMSMQVTSNFRVRSTIVEQIFGTSPDNLPLTFGTSANVVRAIYKYDEMLSDKRNIFFEDNRLLPWINVNAMRFAKKETCPNAFLNNPDELAEVVPLPADL